MRTLIVGSVGTGGHARYCMTLAHALTEQGMTVELHGTPLFPAPLLPQIKVLRTVDRFARTAAFSARTLSAIRKFQPQIIHYQLTTPLVDASWIPMVSRRIPSVLTVHNVEPHERKVIHHPVFLKPVLRAMDALLLHSRANERRFLALHPEFTGRTVCVPHGAWVPPERLDRVAAKQRLDIPIGHPVVLFFGGVRRNKGLELLIRALGLLQAQAFQPMPMLVVAGGLPAGQSFDPYAALIDSLGLTQHSRTRIEFIPDADVGLYYGAADVVALPYAPDFQAQSGVLLEAYGYGVPVVATDVGAIGETVRDDATGEVVATQHPEAFAEALARLLSVPRVREEMSGRMKALMEGTYAWPRVAQRTAQIYADVLERRSSLSGKTPPASGKQHRSNP